MALADLYLDPVSYGINDVSINTATDRFVARIYYPSLEGNVHDVGVRPGAYPLIAFAHGDRRGDPSLCPRDLTRDYQRWGGILHALAKSGYVVIAPSLTDVIATPESSAHRLDAAIMWARSRWQHRAVLHRRPVVEGTATHRTAPAHPRPTASPLLDAAPLGSPTPLGLIGHSWGAKACAELLAQESGGIASYAALAGTFDDNESVEAVTQTTIPMLLVAGSNDGEAASYLQGLWPSQRPFRHQGLLKGLGHWDWFTRPDGILPCSTIGSAPTVDCTIGWRMAAELMLGFERKYLSRVWQHPPYLLGPTRTRTTVSGNFGPGRPCALVVRWDDPLAPQATPPQPQHGTRHYGVWADPPW